MNMEIIIEIEQWIDSILIKHIDKKISCYQFVDLLRGFYKPEFLAECAYVIVEKIPKPDINIPGTEDFLKRDFEGITYKNTYFIKKNSENKLYLHFHELVHVAQWSHLGAKQFISRYLNEILTHGYDNAPLEVMAKKAEICFKTQRAKVDIPVWVVSSL